MRVLEHRTRSAQRSLGSSAILLVLMAVVFGGCAGSPPSGDVTMGLAQGEGIEVTIEDGSFQPDRLLVDGDTSATIEVTNADDMPHDFAISALELNTGLLEEGEAATAEIVLRQDELGFVCTLHEDMRGTITVGAQ